MHLLTALPVIVLVIGWSLVSLGIAMASRWAVRAFVPVDERDQVAGIAAPLMPALGAAFAILVALTLVGEAGYLRAAQDLVSNEAGQASRLAWAATTPTVATAPIHGALGAYLVATRAREWQPIGTGEDTDPDVATALSSLERAVRVEATRAEVGTPASTELLASLDALTTGRRARIAAASRELPLLYVLTLLVCGAALVANAGALTFRSGPRTSLLVAGLAIVVAMSLALMFAISGPWEGALQVAGEPVDTVIRDLGNGLFHA